MVLYPINKKANDPYYSVGRFCFLLFAFLPIFIMTYRATALIFLVDAKFYSDFFYYADNIDTILVIFSLFHAFFYWFDYSKITKICIFAIMLTLILTFFEPFLTQDFYYYAYYLIFTSVVSLSIFFNLK